MHTIKRGDVLTFKPEWSDPGDENVTFRAIENEDGGRVKVVAELGLPLNPTHVVRVAWVATVNGQELSKRETTNAKYDDARREGDEMTELASRIALAREANSRIAPHDDDCQVRYSIARIRDGRWGFYSMGLSIGPCFERDHVVDILRKLRAERPHSHCPDELRVFAHQRLGKLDAEDFAFLTFRVIDEDWGVWE